MLSEIFTPEVMITDWNLSNTGLMAIEASIHVKLSTGLDMVGVLSSKGSMISAKPTTINVVHVLVQSCIYKFKYFKINSVDLYYIDILCLKRRIRQWIRPNSYSALQCVIHLYTT